MTALRVASLSLFVLLLVFPHPASAQRDRFFATLPALYRSLAGAYGDEGPEIAAHVETLSQALTNWDRDVGDAESGLRAKLTGADDRNALDVHVELLLLYVERGRLRDALRAIDEAIRIDPRSAGRLRYKALLHRAVGSPVEAADAFRAAWMIDPADPQNAYWLVVQRSANTTDTDIEQALATLRSVERELVQGRRRPEPPIPVVVPINDDVGRATPFAPAGYARPFALLLSGEFVDGVAALKAAVASDPLIADLALRLEPMARGVAALRQGMVPEAIALLETATLRAPDSSEAHRMLGTAHAVNGDIDEAVRDLRRAVQLDPRNERAWLTLARTLEGLDNVEEAAQALRDAIVAVPDAGAVRWLLSTLAPRLQRTDETDAELIAVADRLVLLAGRGELYGQVANRAQSHLNYDRAIELLEKRVDLTPNNPTAHRALGTAYIDDGREAAGYAELVMALLLDPDGADTLAALGRVHLAAVRYTAAAEALQKAIALQPSNGEALQALGDALVHDGKVEDGRRRIEEAARAQTAAVEEQRRMRTFGMLGSQATLSMQQSDYERAIALRQQVIELDPGNAGHYLRLADTLVRAKRLGDAETQLRTAISLGGGPEAHRRLAEVLAGLGRSEQSALERQQYRDLRLQELRARSGGSR
jgi:tetratricopeptide (TPR) repeat protein